MYAGDESYGDETTSPLYRPFPPRIEQRPLLAQCAALLDSLLGGPVAGSGIIDEIRRVRAELAKEGW